MIQRGCRADIEDFVMTGEVTAAVYSSTVIQMAKKLKLSVRLSKEVLTSAHDQQRLKELEGTQFFQQLNDYIQGVERTFVESMSYSNPEMAAELTALVQQTQELRIFEKLNHLELPREDWDQMKKLQKRMADGKNFTPPIPFKKLSTHLDFYVNAEKRDQVFIKNLSVLSEDRLKTKPQTVVMIAGGFHTRGLTSRLEKAGFNYAVVMPRVKRIPGAEVYRNQMQGKISWKDYFKVENGRIDLYQAFVRATRDKLLYRGQIAGLSSDAHTQIDLQMLKDWRDQLIRDLAATGRIEQAASYTRYLDELTGSKSSGLLDKVESFIQGLHDLDNRHERNTDQIARLIQAHMTQTFAAVASAVPGNRISAGLATGRASSMRREVLNARSETREDPVSLEQIERWLWEWTSSHRQEGAEWCVLRL